MDMDADDLDGALYISGTQRAIIKTNSKLQIKEFPTISDLTHCGLVTSYGDRDLGQHWLR